MQNIHVLMRKEDLDPSRLAGKVAVVIDVLFATSTIAAAFEAGVSEVVPAAGPDAARAAAAGLEPDSYLLAGEHNLEPIPGFATYAPLALSREPLSGRRLIYSTTNGTVALSRASGAKAVYAGTLLNGAAVARHIARNRREETVLLVCSGSGGGFNLEDFFGAGYIVDRLLDGAEPERWRVSDAAKAARRVYLNGSADPLECLRSAELGTLVESMGASEEVRFVARPGAFETVPLLDGGRLVRAGGV